MPSACGSDHLFELIAGDVMPLYEASSALMLTEILLALAEAGSHDDGLGLYDSSCAERQNSTAAGVFAPMDNQIHIRANC